MAFIITDIADESKEMVVNAWNWAPTAELIRSLSVLDAHRSETLRYNLATEVSADEAKMIGVFIRDEVLVELKPAQRITLDLTVTEEPDDGTLHREDFAWNYSGTFDWLKRFSEFCLASHGFKSTEALVGPL